MALSGTAIVAKSFYAAGVNLKNATSTIIVPAISGKKFIPRTLWAVIASISGTGTTASIKIGNGGTFDLRAAASLGANSTTALNMINLSFDGTTKPFVFDIGTTGLSVTVTAASTYTTHTADFYIEGYIV